VVSDGLPLYPYSEGLDVSADGNVTVWTETSDAGNQTVVFRGATGLTTDVKIRFPGLDPQRTRRFLTRGRGALSDDGQQVVFADGARHVLLNLATGANATLFEESVGAKQVFLSGNAQFVLYHQGGAPSLTPVRALVRNLATGADEALTVTTRSTFGTHLSSDGRFVLFNTSAGVAPEDLNGTFDFYLRDRLNRTNTRVTVDERGAEFSGHTSTAVMSRNGQWVVFQDPSGVLRRVRNPSF